MPTESIVLRRVEDRDQRIQWNASSPLHSDLKTRTGQIRIRHGIFRGGVSEGVEVVRLTNEKLSVDVLPTRGMSLWRLNCGGARYGWLSPVAGPVHPAFVPLSEPSGLGWLSGFDELVVRCGLESNGAPEHDASGQLLYPLHGHIGNTPADSLAIEYDEASGRVDLVGEVIESRMFFKRFRMRSRIRLHADRQEVELLDDVTNELEHAATMQMLYHVNLGPPVLSPTAKLVTAVEEVCPRDPHAAEDLDRWKEFDPPTVGYRERVYFAKPLTDESGYGHAMLIHGEGGSAGTDESPAAMAVSFKTATLPYLVLWKNTAAQADGYVVGIEPATGFPNPRGFEAEQGRLVELAGGETKSFRMRLRPLDTPEAIDSMRHTIESLSQAEGDCQLHRQPVLTWSPAADG